MRATILSDMGLAAILLMYTGAASGQPHPTGTAFTYQGQLEDGGAPANGQYDFEFKLCDDPAAPCQVAATTVVDYVDDHQVDDGLFTVEIDFGSDVFNGQARWLELGVRPGATVDPYTILSPRQELTPTPHALTLPGLWIQQNAVTEAPNLIGGYAGNEVTAGAIAATISGGGSETDPNHVYDDYGTVAGGGNNRAGSDDANSTTATYATVSGGRSNTASGWYSTISGGQANQVTAEYGTIAGGRLNEAISVYATVGGGRGNSAQAQADHATIAGGLNNLAYDPTATVAGGNSNIAGTDNGNPDDAKHATVGGGLMNRAEAFAATVGGGWNNKADGNDATVGGGKGNTASGFSSTVPGGLENTAGALFAFAAGRRAKANHMGTFVWADSDDNDFASTSANTFLVRASGGVGIGTNNPTEQLDVAGNIHASGTITSGSSITIDGTAGSEKITSTADLELHVSSGRALRLELDPTSPNFIGGYGGNSVTTGVKGATIGGGGENGFVNSVTDDYGTVGGGRNNQAAAYATTVGGGYDNDASADYSTVGGGKSNSASGWAGSTVGGGYYNNPTGDYSTVGGGFYNTPSGAYSTVGGGESNANDPSGDYSTVGGGGYNDPSGYSSTVGGGMSNEAAGDYSTVPGGHHNKANGNYSFAAGRRAKVRSAAEVGGGDIDGDEGTFVWADSTNVVFPSTGPDQFLVRASGGMWLGTTSSPSIPAGRFINTSTGGYLTSGGIWTDSSDRAQKDGLAAIDARDILKRVSTLPISTWRHKAEEPSVRHMGAMAQDFYAAFGLGSDERHIAALDTGGVALAAIQGLHDIVNEKECEIEMLRAEKDAEIEALEKRNGELGARLAALERIVDRLAQKHEGGVR
ncbi:MAG: hypothetical protein JSU86_17185 [Phycisphaerales bacterium]|nr:MAG: hypothetical protein JSU86_17185 [Phycisphaerales bacterium]